MIERLSDAVRAASDSRDEAREDPAAKEPRYGPTPYAKRTGPWWARPGAVVSLSIAGLFIALALGGAAYWWLTNPDAGAETGDYVEVFLTDLPADMSALEVTLSGVYIGEDGHALHVDAPVFDLLQLQGPTQSLRVASGFVPEGNHSFVRIVFAQAIATIGGQQVALEIPETQLNLEHGRSGIDTTSSAILFDIDVESSVVATDGGFAFRPYVASVYVHEYTQKPGRAADGTAESGFTKSNQPEFKDDGEAKPPARQSTSRPDVGASGGGNGGSDGGSGGDTGSGNGTDNTTDGIAPDLGGTAGDETDLVNQTGGMVERELDVIIQYTAGQTATIATYLGGLAVQVLHTFPGEDAAYVKAKLSQIQDIAANPDVQYIELVKPVEWTLDTSKQAVRADGLGDLLTGLTDASGNPIDGRGIGVAIIDTGVDATHPDLPYNTGLDPNPAVIANYKIESVSFQLNLVPLPSTDTTSGHGTHVAGIVAGQGNLDAGHTGVAPGAKLYGLGIGEATTTLWTSQGLAWVRENHDKVDPPIRVVTNSWTTGTSYDPNAYSSRLVRDLVAEGVVVVFAAGNNGGDGSSVRTSGEGQNPAEGVIMVGATSDREAGDRDGPIRSSSSRGQTNVPSSWPDVMAPGTSIMSTKAFASLSGLGLLERYVPMSGTSMAAPHVAGVAALMLQADPSLSPAQVEAILESTAYPFSDGGGYSSTYSDIRYNGSHHAKGHGLVDARAAVEVALT